MELKQALEKLDKIKEYNNLIKENKDIYFSYALITVESSKTATWQLGFYNKSTDKMATFTIGSDKIEIQKDEEIFKKPDTEVKPIDTKKAKLKFSEIMEKANRFKNKEYPKETVSKTIAILQNLEGYGTIWNLTFVTDSFKTLNMKINAESNKVVHHSLQSLMDLVKK